jgi:glycogen(starch) synthase
MRVALVSFEFPPAVAVGGIGTYAWEAARMLATAGNDVEVFAAGQAGEEPAEQFGAQVHRFAARDRTEFAARIVETFSDRHEAERFDVLESPEIGAEANEICHRHSAIPRVVKLHTPNYVVSEIGYDTPSLAARVRFTAGALRQGRFSLLERPRYSADADLECLWTRDADEVAAPTRAIGERVQAKWDLDPAKISYFPLPFRPAPAMLELPLPSCAQTVGFLGRLEPRKGILELAAAIPTMLKAEPHLRFRLLGPSWPYRHGDMEMSLREKLRKQLHAIEFVGSVPRDRLADELAQCDAVVLPSRWESFGYVCPEAMSAGRAVIGSSAGGMAEMIEDGHTGLLVPPRSPRAIADAVLKLVRTPELVQRLAVAGRESIQRLLDPERIYPLQMASYRRAVERAKQRIDRSAKVHA